MWVGRGRGERGRRGRGCGHEPKNKENPKKDTNKTKRKCFVRDKAGHLVKDCENTSRVATLVCNDRTVSEPCVH